MAFQDFSKKLLFSGTHVPTYFVPLNPVLRATFFIIKSKTGIIIRKSNNIATII